MTKTHASDIAQDVDADIIAAACKASADPLRLRILNVLQRSSFAVLELCHVFNHKQSGLSHHLKVLAQGGLVETHREGNTIFYRRSTESSGIYGELIQNLLAAANHVPLDTEQLHRIEEVYAERSLKCEQFFQKVGSEYNEHQEQIAQASTYLSACLQLIDGALISGKQSLLEIGPGEGPLLNDLCERFETVYALDTSAEMLARAKSNCSANNIQYVNGDIHHHAITNQQFNCIVLSMVLHHVASPADLLADIAKRLSNDGVLVLTDLAEHEQDWVQDQCGDLWLGFNEAMLDRWAHDAGLKLTQSMCLSQRNGFQVLAKQFTPAAQSAH